MSGIQTRLDGSTLVVRFPIQFQICGGRKRVVAPDGSAIMPTSKPQPDGTLVKALARAWRWRGLLEEGRFASVRELAEAADSDAHGEWLRTAPENEAEAIDAEIVAIWRREFPGGRWGPDGRLM